MKSYPHIIPGFFHKPKDPVMKQQVFHGSCHISCQLITEASDALPLLSAAGQVNSEGFPDGGKNGDDYSANPK